MSTAPTAPAAEPAWALVPKQASEAILRPFYECPPEELAVAWVTALHVAAVTQQRAEAAGTHRRVFLPSAWEHEPGVELTAFAVRRDDRPVESQGRASVTFTAGGFELRLAATPAELQQLAQALLNTAAEQIAFNAAPAPAPAIEEVAA